MPQKSKKHFLFVCTAGIQRSPTARDLFRNVESIKAKSAGVHSLAIKRIRQSMIKWADEIFVMSEKNDKHLSILRKRFDLSGKEVHDLDIPDVYPRDDPELINILKQKLQQYL